MVDIIDLNCQIIILHPCTFAGRKYTLDVFSGFSQVFDAFFSSYCHIYDGSLINACLSKCVSYFYCCKKGDTRHYRKLKIVFHCMSPLQHISPRAKVPPPILIALDTLTQGEHADPISCCFTRPIGGHNTPQPCGIYLLVPCAPVWPPSNALGCPSDNSLSPSD